MTTKYGAIMRPVFLFVLLLGIVDVAKAQREVVAAPTTGACNAVKAALQTTPLPAASDSSWTVVPECVGGGAAFATAIGSLAGLTDTSLMNAALQTARNFRDDDAFEAFRALALNASATTLARGTGFYGMLIEVVSPYLVLSQPITTVLAVEPCSSTSAVGPFPFTGTALGSDARLRLATAARAVFKGDSESAAVRAAARCAYSFVRGTVPADVSSLALYYVCGDKFRIYHTSPETAVGVTWTVDNVPMGLKLDVPSKKHTYFFAGAVGTVRIYYNGGLMDTENNGNTPC